MDVIWIILLSITGYFVVEFVIYFILRLFFYVKKSNWKKRHNNVISVGFFHPYCNAGGGGERVLWTAIRAVQEKYKNVHCVVYSGDAESAEEILKNVELRFNIKLLREIEIIHLKHRECVEDTSYRFCTLFCQSQGSTVLAVEALLKHVPDIYIDTMGYAWTLQYFKYWGAAKVGAYVHYPTISTDMIETVQNRKIAVNNKQFISNSLLFSCTKLMYYKIFALYYGWVGRRADVIMVNSSWTRDHILKLWKKPECTFTVYPPCDVSEFNKIPLEAHGNKTRFLSIAQFRPEKNHELQIRAFHIFLKRLDDVECAPTLVLIGSCRHEQDYERVENLKNLSSELEILQNIEFKVNLTFQEIIQEMENSSVALHTMKDEHFGIGVVECMSAGLIMIAHDSAGPKMDIVVDYNGKKTGFLANDVESFAEAMEKVWRMDNKELHEIRTNARESVSRFSVLEFENNFLKATQKLFR